MRNFKSRRDSEVGVTYLIPFQVYFRISFLLSHWQDIAACFEQGSILCYLTLFPIMSDSEPGFTEKVVIEEREHNGPSYRSLVSSMRFRNPILAKLDGILTRQGPSSEDGRVAVIELHDNHVAVRRLHTSDELLDYMTNLEQLPPPSCNRRLYLLEGLPSNYIEILGSRLRIDPDVFARQIDCGYLTILKDARDIPMLPSHPTSKDSFSLRYNELRDFGKNIDSFEVRCTNQPRRKSTTKWEGKFDGVSIVRRKASFWSRMNGAKGWNGASISIHMPPNFVLI
jgi:hypothetical protein